MSIRPLTCLCRAGATMASRLATANAQMKYSEPGVAMTVDTMPTRSCPNVFDAGLPILVYEHVDDPEEAHRLVARARGRAPIAIGTHGPEILSYELVRAVLRDPRFRVPKGVFLPSHGI